MRMNTCFYQSNPYIINRMAINTNSFNPRPRFTEYLVRTKAFLKSPLIVVDIGARNGAGKEWQVYRDQHRVIGFEADEKECKRLNESLPEYERYYPVALSFTRGARKFYVHTQHAPTSSFFDSDASFLSRFPGWQPFMPDRSIMLETTDFKSFAKKNKIRDINVMKLDVEGAELDILRGLGKDFEKKLICINTEAYFQPWAKDSPTFADMDIFLRARGFVLYDLPILRWEKKTTSPYMFTDGVFGPTDRGQVVFTQALYLKDAVAEFNIPRLRKNWSAERILKLASVMELYNLEDCAIELIQEASALGLLKSYKTHKMIDLLTPPIDGHYVTYKQYVEHIKQSGPPRYIDGRRVSQSEYTTYIKNKK